MYRMSISVEQCSGTSRAPFLDLSLQSNGTIHSVPSTAPRTLSSCSPCAVSRSVSYRDVEPRTESNTRSRMECGSWSKSRQNRGLLRHTFGSRTRVSRTSTTGSGRFSCRPVLLRLVKSCESNLRLPTLFATSIIIKP